MIDLTETDDENEEDMPLAVSVPDTGSDSSDTNEQSMESLQTTPRGGSSPSVIASSSTSGSRNGCVSPPIILDTPPHVSPAGSYTPIRTPPTPAASLASRSPQIIGTPGSSIPPCSPYASSPHLSPLPPALSPALSLPSHRLSPLRPPPAHSRTVSSTPTHTPPPAHSNPSSSLSMTPPSSLPGSLYPPSYYGGVEPGELEDFLNILGGGSLPGMSRPPIGHPPSLFGYHPYSYPLMMPPSSSSPADYLYPPDTKPNLSPAGHLDRR